MQVGGCIEEAVPKACSVVSGVFVVECTAIPWSARPSANADRLVMKALLMLRE